MKKDVKEGSVNKNYIYSFGDHIARVDGQIGLESAITYYYICDQVGSVRVVTDSEGTKIWEGEYSPFGELIVESVHDKAFSDNHRFGGKPYETEVGLYYFNARWYESVTGRFISEDPIRDNLNWYGYCGNNPINSIDPTGLLSDEGMKRLKELYGDNIEEKIIKAEELRETYMNASKNNETIFITPQEMQDFFAGMSLRLELDIKRIAKLKETNLKQLESEFNKVYDEHMQFLKDVGVYKSFVKILKDSSIEVLQQTLPGFDQFGNELVEDGVDNLAYLVFKKELPISDLFDLYDIVNNKLKWADKTLRKNDDYFHAEKDIANLYSAKKIHMKKWRN